MSRFSEATLKPLIVFFSQDSKGKNFFVSVKKPTSPSLCEYSWSNYGSYSWTLQNLYWLFHLRGCQTCWRL